MRTESPKIKAILLMILATMITGCGVSKQILTKSEAGRAHMLPVPFYRQEVQGKCGVVALRAVLDYYGVGYDDIGSIYNAEINGTKVVTIVNYANRYVDARTGRYGYDEIAAAIRAGGPLIILQKYNDSNHFSVVKGFLLDERKIIINDGYNENVVVSLIKEQARLINEKPEEKELVIIFNKKLNEKEKILK